MKTFVRFLCLCLMSPSLYAQAPSTDASLLVNAYLAEQNINGVSYFINRDELDDQTGIRQIHAWERQNGVDVKYALLNLQWDKTGKRYTTNSWSTQGAVFSSSTPTIGASQAVTNAISKLNFPLVGNLQVKSGPLGTSQSTVFDRGIVAAEDPKARLIYLKNAAGSYDLTWEVQLFTRDRQSYWIAMIDANTGVMKSKEDKVKHCEFGGVKYDASPAEYAQLKKEQSARAMVSAESFEKMIAQKAAMKKNAAFEVAVPTSSNMLSSFMVAPANTYKVLPFPGEFPGDRGILQANVTTAGGNINAAPYGWTSVDGTSQFTYTKGNNVWAFYDPSPGSLGGVPSPSNSGQPTNTPPSGTAANQYIYTADFTKEPEYSNTSTPANLYPNRNAATTNLFYVNNMMHDIFYNYGFDEKNRNFQSTNIINTQDRGGMGNDDVLAQSQDAGGTNNANMLTLADGTNGQMQMYLWTTAALDKILRITNTGGSALMVGDRFEAVQGALYNGSSQPATTNLFTNPVTDKAFVLSAEWNVGSVPATYTVSPKGCGQGSGANDGPGGPTGATYYSNKIVLIDRGDCSFVEKAVGAQNGGASAVIVMNNDAAHPDAVLAMGGDDATVNTITIPSVMVSYNNGLKLKAAVAASNGTARGTLKLDNLPKPKRDGDFDNGVVAHEYTHGISNRLSPQDETGGTLSGDEQGGEGWSDFAALYTTTQLNDISAPVAGHPNGVLPDRGIGTYVIFEDPNGAGIRPTKYSISTAVNPYLFGGTPAGTVGIHSSGEAHDVGFIWCTFLYEIFQKMVDIHGVQNDIFNGGLDLANSDPLLKSGGNNVVMRLVLQGIKNQEPNPRFDQERDAILRADTMLYGGQHACAIWNAFAKRGLGKNMINGSNSIGDETDGFSVPSACDNDQAFLTIVKTAAATSLMNGDNMVYTLAVKNTSPTGSAATNVEVIDQIPANTTIVSTSDPYTTISGGIKFTIASIPANTTRNITITLQSAFPQTSTVLRTYNFDGTAAADGWTFSAGADAFSRKNNGTVANGNAHSGTGFISCPDPDAGTAPVYAMSPKFANATTNGTQLRFWHKYSTDGGYDGGFVEVTDAASVANVNDPSVTWTQIPVQENGYNGVLDATFNASGGNQAFTGTTLGYIESAATLPTGTTYVRFGFSADVAGNTGTPTGWFIDDVRLISSPTFMTNTASVFDAASGYTSSSTASSLVLGNAVLGVDLLNLTAKSKVNSIALDWKTNSEVNNKGFHIERRSEQENDFMTIGFVKGVGNSTVLKQYTFEDKNIETGKNYYYRLRQEGNDGKTTYSNVVLGLIQATKIASLSVFPNPTRESANIYLNHIGEGATLKVLSIDGRLMYSANVTATDSQTINLNTNQWASGVYMVQVKSGSSQLLQKMVIQQ